MAAGPSTQNVYLDYMDEEFQAFGIEVTNGSAGQTNGFLSTTGITYPTLLNALSQGVGAAYATGRDEFFVVGGDGIIIWRGASWNNSQCRAAIDQGLADLTTAAEDLPDRDGFRLHAAYPNPFNPATNIAYTIAGAGEASVDLKITDVRGRTVRSLFSGSQPPGTDYVVRWDGMEDSGRPANSGMYLAALTVRGVTQSRFITLVK